ncbi:MAG: hypothetical protein F4123_12980 [Gemmatimonadetes bacterium]|nr:hypothetical protein [Gemmatimonadota bacterium]
MGRRRSAKRRAGFARKKREARERKTGTGNKGGKGDTGKRGGDRPPSSGAEWLKAGVLAFFLFFILRLFILQTFVITSGSMEGTLLVGDFLVVNRAAIGSRVPFTDIRIPGYSEPRRGDVLVFDPHLEYFMTLVYLLFVISVEIF